MSSYSQQVGKLSPSAAARSGGRKVDTWRFSRPSPHAIGGSESSITVDIYLVQANGAEIFFSARSPALPTGSVNDPNIQALHARVLQVLTEQSEILDRVTWEPWLEVQSGLDTRSTMSRVSHAEQTRKLSVTYRPLLRGVHPDDPSRVFTINSNGTAVPFPTPRTPATVDEAMPSACRNAAELSEALRKHDSRTPGDTYAYLPDTPANRAALEHIMAAMESLSERLHALFDPSAIVHNLEHLDRSTLALPEPKAS